MKNTRPYSTFLTLIGAALLIVATPVIHAEDNFPALESAIKIAKKTLKQSDKERAIEQLEIDAQSLNNRIETLIEAFAENSDIITSEQEYIRTSQQKAIKLFYLNTLGEELIQIVDNFVKLKYTTLNKRALLIQSHHMNSFETALPGYRKPAFNEVLKQTIEIQAKISFYFPSSLNPSFF